ncbi:MAG: hypothetical protein R3B45_09160 [Bdellovibrionota bacterium]
MLLGWIKNKLLLLVTIFPICACAPKSMETKLTQDSSVSNSTGCQGELQAAVVNETQRIMDAYKVHDILIGGNVKPPIKTEAYPSLRWGTNPDRAIILLHGFMASPGKSVSLQILCMPMAILLIAL